MTALLSRTLKQAAWAPVAVFIFYAVAAKGFNAYLLHPWLDMPTHFCGGGGCRIISSSFGAIEILADLFTLEGNARQYV